MLSNAGDGKLVVGIKFDQPGLGLKNPDGSFSGFDVEVAKYVAEQLGVPVDSIEFKESKSAEREGLIERGEVDYIVATYSITDTRKEKVNFAARTSSPPRTCWSSRTTPTSPGQRRCPARSCAR